MGNVSKRKKKVKQGNRQLLKILMPYKKRETGEKNPEDRKKTRAKLHLSASVLKETITNRKFKFICKRRFSYQHGRGIYLREGNRKGTEKRVGKMT